MRERKGETETEREKPSVSGKGHQESRLPRQAAPPHLRTCARELHCFAHVSAQIFPSSVTCVILKVQPISSRTKKLLIKPKT